MHNIDPSERDANFFMNRSYFAKLTIKFFRKGIKKLTQLKINKFSRIYFAQLLKVLPSADI